MAFRQMIDLSRPKGWIQLCLLVGVCLAPDWAAMAQSRFLEQLDQQSQSLYNQVQDGLVSVQVPLPPWVWEMLMRQDPLRQWEPRVDLGVSQALEAMREQALRGASPSWPPLSRGGGGSAATASTMPAGFVPNNIGLVLDEAGHVLVPIYVEKPAAGDAPLPLMLGGKSATGTFVGSDDKTQMTILKLSQPLGRPVKLTGVRPPGGSLVMVFSPPGNAAKLVLWTGGQHEYGVVIGMGGAVAGIARFDQFLAGADAMPVVDQLIRLGKVRRATLGARLSEVHPDDPSHRQALADRPALLVEEVTQGSLAESSGLREGDFILKSGDQPLFDLTTWAALSARGGKTELTILRGGETRKVSIDLTPE
jgi:hypothetical protein